MTIARAHMTLERRVVAEDEAALEFHRGGALTFRGLESTGIIDRPLRLPFDERPCAIPSRPVRPRGNQRGRNACRLRELDSGLFSRNEKEAD